MKAFLRLLAGLAFLSSPVALVAQTLGPPSGGAPSGVAGGDLGGTYPNPTVLNLAHVTSGPPKIIPALDGTTAFQVTKADGTTPVAIFDTTNSALNIGSTQVTGAAVRLGIYASSTTNAFRAVGDGVLANVSLERYSTDTQANNITFLKTRGSLASPTAVVAGDNAAVIAVNAYDGVSSHQIGLQAFTIDTVTAGDNLSSYWSLWTRPDGLGASATERVRVTKTGGVNIGAYTTDPGAGNLNVTGNYLVGGSQIACANLSGVAASCATDATNASNLASGTVPVAVMGNAAFVRFKLLGANLNTTVDQPITITLPTGSTRFKSGQATIGLVISNPSISMTTAVCGLWTGASKSGVTIVGSAASGVAMSGLTSASENTNGNMISPAINNSGTISYNLTGNSPANTLYFACSTAQGATATADVTVTVEVLN